MAEITSEMVAKLRATTGAGLMDCKKALTETQGNFDEAIRKLREKGAASAAKRADRTSSEGLITAVVDPSGQRAAIVELNCETDFVARTDDFQKFLTDLTQQIVSSTKPWSSVQDAPQDKIRDVAAKLGENVQLRDKRFARFDRQEPSIFSTYVHNTGVYKEGFGKVGVLFEVGAQDKVLSAEETKTLAKDLAMQVAATSPRWLRKEDVPQEILEQEKNIAREQAKRENKPEKIWDKIVQGKLQQFYQQFCLLEQPYVKGEGKVSVAQHVESVSQKVGVPLIPKRFVRLKVGETE